jgi:hypothetical protein
VTASFNLTESELTGLRRSPAGLGIGDSRGGTIAQRYDCKSCRLSSKPDGDHYESLSCRVIRIPSFCS